MCYLTEKAIKEHFQKVTNSGFMQNKTFWKTITPFITNKSGINNDNNIMSHKEGHLVTDEEELATILNHHYVNIVENSSEKKPNFINYKNAKDKEELIQNILNNFSHHPSIIKIKETNRNINKKIQFKEIDNSTVEKLFSELNTKSSAGEDKIPPKLVKMAKRFLIKPVKDAINSSIRSKVFPTKSKRATITPIDKGGKDKTSIGNYRPVSILNVFSKFYEYVIKKSNNNFCRI